MHAMPSMKALLEAGRVGVIDSPKKVHPRIELEASVVVVESTTGSGEAIVETVVEIESTKGDSNPEPRTRQPRPSGFGRPAGCMSPLSEYVETEFMKAYESPSKAALPAPRFGTSFEECKEEK